MKNHWNSTLKRRAREQRASSLVAVTTKDSATGTASSSGLVPLEDDPLTALTLAPPGIGNGAVEEGVAHHQTPSAEEGVPSGFWDVMRDVIAREVREYVSSNFSDNSRFH